MCLDPAAQEWGSTESGSLAIARWVLESCCCCPGFLLMVIENPSGRTRERPRGDLYRNVVRWREFPISAKVQMLSYNKSSKINSFQ